MKYELNWSRREFLQFMGQSALAGAVLPHLLACQSRAARTSPELPPLGLPFQPLQPSTQDALLLADGFRYDILIGWQDQLNARGDRFGFNNDYTAYIPLRESHPFEGLLWVNHESVDPIFTSQMQAGDSRTRAQVKRELKEVGGSIVHIKKENDRWKYIKNSRFNRRLDATTKIPFIAPRPIEGAKVAVGTLANCAGGVTPWRTVLTCEENYHKFYGDNVMGSDGQRKFKKDSEDFGWHEFYHYPPEHYGWVVEVNPFTGRAKKLTALGRFSHESATVTVASDGRAVVYSGDDKADECVYKFVASRPGSLDQGELFVADTVNGRWLSLDIASNPKLKAAFKDQTDVLIHCREAARIVGATLLDRPEDIEIDPQSGSVLVTLTNNKAKGNFHGSILRINEDGGDRLAKTFKASTFLTGGEASGVSSPDNMAFDKKGNLWLTVDVSDRELNKGPQTPFGNNSLFYIPMSGPHAGAAFRVASAPVTAELTGPSFSPDGHSLFLSVQHPGEGSESSRNPSSHWPRGGNEIPRPSVVVISGPSLDALLA